MICTPIRLALFAILENNLKAIFRDILNEILMMNVFSKLVLDQWNLRGYFYKVLLFCSFALGETLTIKRNADEAPARPDGPLGSDQIPNKSDRYNFSMVEYYNSLILFSPEFSVSIIFLFDKITSGLKINRTKISKLKILPPENVFLPKF